MASKRMNYDRRKFLKFLVISGGAGLFLKFFGASVLDLFSGRKADTIDSKNFSGFRIVQEGKELRIYSKKGEEIFVIDNKR